MQQECNTNSLSLSLPAFLWLSRPFTRYLRFYCSASSLPPGHALSIPLSLSIIPIPCWKSPLPRLFLSIKITVSRCRLIFFFLLLFLQRNISPLWNCFVLSRVLHHPSLRLWCDVFYPFIFSQLHFLLFLSFYLVATFLLYFFLSVIAIDY